jgi:(2Fe-2S) ferredoxin
MTKPEKIKLLFCINDRGAGRRSCAASGAPGMRKEAKETWADTPGIKVKKSGCLGHCKHGPIIQVMPSKAVYRYDGMEDLARLAALPADGKTVLDSLLIKAGKTKKKKKK